MSYPIFAKALKAEQPTHPLARNDIRRAIYPHDDVFWGPAPARELDILLETAKDKPKRLGWIQKLVNALSW